MANVSVWPALDTTVTMDDEITVVTEDGAVLSYTAEVRSKIARGLLLTHDPRPSPSDEVDTPPLSIESGQELTTTDLGGRSGEYNGQPIVVSTYGTGTRKIGKLYRWNAALTTAENGGTIVGAYDVGRWELLESGKIDVSAFGAVGDGTTNDTAAIQAAIAAAKGRVLFFPNGVYKFDDHLYFNNVGIEGESVRTGTAADGGVEFAYYGTGVAMTLYSASGILWKNFRVKSYAANQSGVVFVGFYPRAENIWVEGFDGFSYRFGLGTAATIMAAPSGTVTGFGTYYGAFDGLHAQNITITGAYASCGFFVDGGVGGGVSSNANTFRQCAAKGRFDSHIRSAGGTNNSWWGGNTEIWADVIDPGTLDPVYPYAVYRIDGLNMHIAEVYQEYGGGAGAAQKLVRFAATAVSCTIKDLHIQADLTEIQNSSSAVEDLGLNCRVEWQPVSFNLSSSPADHGKQNLVHNAHFRAWPTAAATAGVVTGMGWFVNSGSWTRVASTRGGKYGVQATATADRFNLMCPVASTSVGHGSPNQVPLTLLRGQTLVASVWAYSATATPETWTAIGNIQISTSGGTSVGQATLSAPNVWERLTAVARIDADATLVSINLRSDNDGNAKTGVVIFTEPSLYIGSDLGKGEPRPLADANAQLFGPLSLSPFAAFVDADATPSVADGNCFNASNTGATTITQFDDGRNGQVLYVAATTANTTVAHNANITTTTGANKALSSGVVYKFVHNGTKWLEF